ncbi:unnamed protein product [Protopolystoma xenopodis]|uniref:Uncharacterized protein n=1 Tax=Protopolystoma xenopodis TaxID=117903 RepID=A0A3S5BVT7_9PLAT|nr:unnamed protein product [Protopolystoma xenopodis]
MPIVRSKVRLRVEGRVFQYCLVKPFFNARPFVKQVEAFQVQPRSWPPYRHKQTYLKQRKKPLAEASSHGFTCSCDVLSYPTPSGLAKTPTFPSLSVNKSTLATRLRALYSLLPHGQVPSLSAPSALVHWAT